MTEGNNVNQDKEVNVNWLRINVPSLVTVVVTGISVAMYIQSMSSRVQTLESNGKSRSDQVDKNFDDIKSALAPLVNLPYRMSSVESNLVVTNQRMDTYLQTIGAKIDGMGDRVSTMSTKVEVLSQKIDSITPEKRADTQTFR